MLRVRAAQEHGDLIGIGVPALRGIRQFDLVVRLGRSDQLSGDGDVILQQCGQSGSGGVPSLGKARVIDLGSATVMPDRWPRSANILAVPDIVPK